VINRVFGHLVMNRKLDQVSKSECSLQPLTTMPQPGNPNVLLHFYDSAGLTLDTFPRRTSSSTTSAPAIYIYIASIRSTAECSTQIL
jgi:hypothetical protein